MLLLKYGMEDDLVLLELSKWSCVDILIPIMPSNLPLTSVDTRLSSNLKRPQFDPIADTWMGKVVVESPKEPSLPLIATLLTPPDSL
jgi:hypothetical protein